MILTKEEIQAITLNAKFVHKYADQAFFASEINEAPRRLGDQAHLNFFVRYHHRDAPERYSWSRVRRVVMLEDVMAAAKAKNNSSSSNSGGMATAMTTTASSSSSSSTAAVTSATVEWKGKTFWVGFMVESVKTAATAASAHSNETGGIDSTNQDGEAEASQNDPTPKKEAHLHHDNDGEEEEVFVALTQLSNTVPEDAEVLAFCVASAARRAGERYEDAESADAAPVLDVMPLYEMSPEATQAEPVLDAEGNVIESDTAVLATDESDAAAAAATLAALPDARAYVPTARQAELLKAYKKQHFAQHQWSPEEIEASKQLRLKYSSIGVAAAPVRTVAYVHEHRVVERRQRVSTASPVGQLLVGAAELTQDPLSEMSTQADTQNSQQQQQPQIAVPLSPSAASAVSDTPLSPFLPRSVLRQQQALHGSLNHTVFAGRASPSNASLSLSSSQVGASQPPSPLTPHDTSSALSQHLSQLRAAEDAFYKYVSDEQRSYQLNRLASITLRNSETNAYNRRRGIANERRLERRGNLLESRGLWITDDKERAKQAEVYIKETSTSTSDAKKKPDKAPAAATAAAAAAGGGGGAGGTGGEKTDATTSAEEAFVERFRAYHKAQNISFASFEDDSLLSSADADTESMVQAAAAAAALAESKAEGTGDEKEGSGAGGGTRTGRRAVRRLLPNRLNTEEATPLSVQAQLVHRSTVRMAKRARDE